MKAIICGAGIAGLSAAIFLARNGWGVEVIEEAAGLRDSGYMIDFFGPGYDAAEQTGLLDALAGHAYAIDGVELVNADGGRQAFMSYGTFEASLGGRLFSLMRGDIERELHAALPDNVQLHYGTRIDDIHDVSGEVDVTLSDGRRVQADLLVGADGIHSGVRSDLFGPESGMLKYLGFHTAAYVFSADKVRRVAQDRFVMMSLVDRQMGLYTMHDGRVAVYFIWRDDRPERAHDARQVVHEKFGDLDWIVPDVLNAAPDNDEIYYDVVAQIEMADWCRDRAVMLGDSAFAVSLLAGQGSSLAIGGAYVLARELAAHETIADGLAAYEETVKPQVVKKQAAGRRTADWFVPDSAFKVWIRALVFNLSSLPFMSRIVESFVASSPKGVFSARER